MKFLTEIPQGFVSQLQKNRYQIDYDAGNLDLKQNQILKEFIEKHSLEKFKLINCDLWNKHYNSIDDQLPDLLMVSITDRIEIDQLIELIRGYHTQTNKFLYLAINKFKTFSDTVKEIQGINYDHKLITYCSDQLKDIFSLIEYYYIPDDNGTYGNFVHPVTQLFLCKTKIL
jgi:hypothetical protein